MSTKEILELGLSPCPNDTYLFGALVLRLFPTRLLYQPIIEEVEALNQRALKDPLPVSKLSFAAFVYLLDRYQLLPVGAALGFGCGPVLVAKEKGALNKGPVAVPGKMTTASFLLRLYAPHAEQVEMPYDRVLSAVKRGEVAAGVLIHEGRFVYAKEGLILLKDLGAFWEEETKTPIPLGGIFVRRDLSRETKEKIVYDLRESLALARQNEKALFPFIRTHASELEEEVIKQHIKTFVTPFTEDLGELGQRAVRSLLEFAVKRGLIKSFPEDFLWEETS